MKPAGTQQQALSLFFFFFWMRKTREKAEGGKARRTRARFKCFQTGSDYVTGTEACPQLLLFLERECVCVCVCVYLSSVGCKYAGFTSCEMD